MGSCACTAKDSRSQLASLRQRLVFSIDSRRLPLLSRLISKESAHFPYRTQAKGQSFRRLIKKCTNPSITPAIFLINDAIIVLQGIPLNCLSYAFRAGDCAIVKYLVEEEKADISVLYETYKKFNRTPVDVACEYGYLELLQYFLPIHLAEAEKQRRAVPYPTMLYDSYEELSIFSSEPNIVVTGNSQDLKTPAPYQPAIQRACERGHIALVEWLLRYFAGKTPPADFDINATDEKAGENCALVAVREGNLRMIEYLHKSTPADFQAKNRRNENAIQVAASGSKRKDARSYYECMRYLVEKVGVDVTYQCEETLLICEDRALISYLEAQMQQRGVVISKARVDSEFAVLRSRDPRPASDLSQELERKLRRMGGRFQIRELVDEPGEKSYVSSIPKKSVVDVSDLEAELDGE